MSTYTTFCFDRFASKTAPLYLQRLATSPVLVKFLRLSSTSTDKVDTDHVFLHSEDIMESDFPAENQSENESKRMSSNQLHWIQIRALFDRMYLLLFIVLLAYHQFSKISLRS